MMKRIVLFLMAIIYVITMAAQCVTQKGVVYKYNGKNPKTPLGGVYIKVDDNESVLSNDDGTFTLVLDSLKKGTRIRNVQVMTKQDMMVFNQQAVDEWCVREEALCLILCNADEFKKQKDNLVAIGRNEAKKKYEKRLVELKKQNDAKQLQLNEYYNKLDSLEKEYQNALKYMDEYADVFASIDESEVDSIAQKAIELFHKGEIEESLWILEQQDHIEKIKKSCCIKEQADKLISAAERAMDLTNIEVKSLLKDCKKLADIKDKG